MNLPPLPLVDGAFLIDNSALELIQTCPSKYSYAELFKRVAATGEPALDFGTVIHKALEYRYTTCHDKPVSIDQQSVQANLIDELFKDVPVDEEEHRNANFACEIIRRYNLKYQAEPFNVLVDTSGKVICEIPFAIPLYEATYKGAKLPVIFKGRIDLPVQWGDKLIVTDNKTSSMFFGPQRFLDEQRCSNQFRGYCWAFEKATGKVVDGYAVNGIPTKNPPAKPRQGIDNWWSEWLVRDITYLALYPQWREEWVESTVTLVDYILWLYERGSFPMLGKFTRACENYGGCQYKDVCAQPEDKRMETLGGFLYKDNDWSPLNNKQT